MFLCNHHNIYW